MSIVDLSSSITARQYLSIDLVYSFESCQVMLIVSQFAFAFCDFCAFIYAHDLFHCLFITIQDFDFHLYSNSLTIHFAQFAISHIFLAVHLWRISCRVDLPL